MTFVGFRLKKMTYWHIWGIISRISMRSTYLRKNSVPSGYVVMYYVCLKSFRSGQIAEFLSADENYKCWIFKPLCWIWTTFLLANVFDKNVIFAQNFKVLKFSKIPLTFPFSDIPMTDVLYFLYFAQQNRSIETLSNYPY